MCISLDVFCFRIRAGIIRLWVILRTEKRTNRKTYRCAKSRISGKEILM